MAACKMNRSTHAVGDGEVLHNSFSSFARPIYFAARGQQQRLCTSIYAWLASPVCARVHLDTRVHAMHFMQPLVNGALDTDIVPGNANALERENFIESLWKLHVITATSGYFWFRGRALSSNLYQTTIFVCACLQSCFSAFSSRSSTKTRTENLFLTKSREKTQKNENIDFVIN